MKKAFLFLSCLLVSAMGAHADEGMWLPSLISQRIGDMQAKGFRLTAEDVYSVNQASLKDAVVLFGSGCTGELVSDEGLLLTNHHCGYSYIQRHSSVEHDYLKDGFWAMNRGEELPNKGLTVSFLERMEEVTDRVLEGYVPSMTEAQRDSVVRVNSKQIIEENADDGKGLTANVEALFYGNQYFLFVFRVYRDVRLVGAPPSSIGKFGGDTDNWMWPRHTGDFSMFRVYADKDNNPADYSPDNVPYHPKRFFKISRAGVQEGDFTFVYGCPGSTQEYVMSEQVRYVAEQSDPQKIALRTQRLDIQKKYMSMDQKVRIQYSSKNASVSNAWKKWQGEEKGIKKMHTVATKQAYEARFKEWAKGTEYEGLVERLGEIYARRNPTYLAYEYYNETARTIEIVQFASGIYSRLQAGTDTKDLIDSFFKDYYQPIDEETFVAMMTSSRFGQSGVPANAATAISAAVRIILRFMFVPPFASESAAKRFFHAGPANRAFGRKRLEAGDGRKVRRKLRHAHVPAHDRRRRRTPRKRLLVALEHVAFERVAHGRVEGGRELWVLRLERRAFDVRRLAGGLAPRAGEEIPPVTLRPWRKRDAVAAASEHVVAHYVVASAVHLHAAEVRP